MAEWHWINCMCMALCIAAILSHGIGLTLFLKANTRRRVHENIEIVSISLSTILICLIYIVRLLMPALMGHLFYMAVGWSCIPFYCAMILLTLQRFFAIYLHLRYRASRVYTKRKHAVAVTWLIGILVFAVCTSLDLTLGIDFRIPLTVVTGSGPLLTFVIFVCVYAYIYSKYRKASGEVQRTLYTENRSKIFLPFIICVSFFVFGTVPHFFQNAVHDIRYVIIWFCLDSLSNSVVYLFLNLPLLNPVLLARLRRWKKGRKQAQIKQDV